MLQANEATRHPSMQTKAVIAVVLLLVCLSLAACSSVLVGSAAQASRVVLSTESLEGAATETFGSSVSIDGDVAVVGAVLGGVARSGAAYVYRRYGSAWHLEQALTSPEPVRDGFFGASVAVEGDRIAVGARTEGAVYVYQNEGGQWHLVERLQPTDSRPWDNFGASVAFADGRLAVSAPRHHGTATTASGAVYLYDVGKDRIDLTCVIQSDELDAGALFGSSIGMTAETLAIGASYDGSTAAGSGAVYLYDVSGQQPRLVQKLSAPVGFDAHAFGASLALSGGAVAIGSPGEDYGGYRAGPVFVFERSYSSWQLAAVLRPAAGPVQDHFGSAIAWVGRDIVVSAFTDNDAPVGATYAVLFRENGSSWTEEEQPIMSSSNDAVRYASIVSDGATLLVGVPGNSDGLSRVESFSVPRSAR